MSLLDLTFSSVTLVKLTKLTSYYKLALVNRFEIPVVNFSATLL